MIEHEWLDNKAPVLLLKLHNLVFGAHERNVAFQAVPAKQLQPLHVLNVVDAMQASLVFATNEGQCISQRGPL